MVREHNIYISEMRHMIKLYAQSCKTDDLGSNIESLELMFEGLAKKDSRGRSNKVIYLIRSNPIIFKADLIQIDSHIYYISKSGTYDPKEQYMFIEQGAIYDNGQ